MNIFRYRAAKSWYDAVLESVAEAARERVAKATDGGQAHRADWNLRADNIADARQQIAFAVIVALGYHRAVQVKKDHIHRQSCPEIIENLLAKGFVNRAHDPARGWLARAGTTSGP